MSLKGNPENLRAFAKKLRTIGKVVAQRVATKVAPSITTLARSAYADGQTVYGDARPAGVHGNALSLVKSGATQAAMRFVSIGTKVRVQLGPRYARYLIRYGILPNGALPFKWSQQIGEDARAEISKELGN